MPKYPYMPFHVDDYISATDELTTLEHGAYLLLLFKAWKNPDCALPDDDAKLARIVKQPLKVWLAKLRPVLEPFFAVANGAWRQKRLIEVRKHVAKVTEQRRRAAEARWHPEEGSPRGGSDDGSPANRLTNNEPTNANAYPAADRSKKLEKKETLPAVAESLPRAPAREEPSPAGPAATAEEGLPAELAEKVRRETGIAPGALRLRFAALVDAAEGSRPTARRALRKALDTPGVRPGKFWNYASGAAAGMAADKLREERTPGVTNNDVMELMAKYNAQDEANDHEPPANPALLN